MWELVLKSWLIRFKHLFSSYGFSLLSVFSIYLGFLRIRYGIYFGAKRLDCERTMNLVVDLVQRPLILAKVGIWVVANDIHCI